MKLVKKLKAAIKITIVTTTGALAAFTMSPSAQAQQCAATENFQVVTAIDKAFNDWSTGLLDIADEIPNAIPRFQSVYEAIENSKQVAATLKTTSASFELKNKLSQQEKIFEAVAVAVYDDARAKRFNERVQQLLSQNYRVAPEKMNLVDLQILINDFVNWEREAEGLGTETLEAHVGLAAQKFLLMTIKKNRLSWGTERHEVFEAMRAEIDYTKTQVENKFVVMKTRFENSTTIKTGSINAGEGSGREYYGGLLYAGSNKMELLEQTWKKIDDARSYAEALKICKANETIKLLRDKYKQNARNSSYVKLKAAIAAEQIKCDVSTRKFQFKNNSYYLDLGSIPVGMDSMAINFKKTYPNCNIKLLNGSKTVAIINAGKAKPNEPFIASLRPNNVESAAGRKLTRIEITPIGSFFDINEVYVYGSNLAYGATIQGLNTKSGRVVPIMNSVKGTDGETVASNKPLQSQLDRLVVHPPDTCTRLDLRGPQTVGYIRIKGLLGALDGIRNLKITYRDINGSVQKIQDVAHKVAFGDSSLLTITAPDTTRTLRGQYNITTIDIASSDSNFRYAEIEVYRPVDRPD